jgi:dTDP-4-amino-4,6-dideoxygalactose transaminase
MIRNDRILERNSGHNQLPYFFSNESNSSFITFRSGREALVALIRAKRLAGETVLLPGHLPEGIYAPFALCKCKILFYPLDRYGNADIPQVVSLLNEAKILPRLAVFIHYFGVFRNIAEFFNALTPYNIPILEDLAHTYFLTDSSIGNYGKYVLFSLPKIVGVTDGGVLVVKEEPLLNCRLTSNLPALIYSLLKKISLAFASNCQWLKVHSLLNRLSYDILMSYFMRPTPQSHHARRNWEKIDHDFIICKRRQHATIYKLNLVNNNVLCDPNLDIIRDVLMGFPVFSAYRDKLEQHLLSHGVKPLKFTHKWGFLPEPKVKEFSGTCMFRDNHLLLPLNHNLRESDIHKVVSIVNSFSP